MQYQSFRMEDLIPMSLEAVRALPQKPTWLYCDDGKVECVVEELVLSWFLWEFHRLYPKTPKKTTHTFANRILTPKTHLTILGEIQKDAYFASRESEYESLLPYNKLVYQIYNNLYNFMSGELTPYITSIDILDYIEVLDQPDIKEANETIRNLPVVDEHDIAKAYTKITHALEADKSLINNSLARAFTHKFVDINQILQDIGPRGYITDIDGHRFRYPIRSNYAEGITLFRDYIAESRTASTAEIMSGAPMQDAEYLNRLLQLSVSRVKNLSKSDCGTTEMIDWFVDTKSKLKDLTGMYFYDESVGKQVPIDPVKHKHLVGKQIKLRTVFNCKHPDRQTICAKCYGDLAYNQHDTDNIGHIAAIEFQSGQSQQILSFKHLTTSSSSFGVYISELAKEYLEICNNESAIRFLNNIDLTGVKIQLSSYDMRGFEALKRVDNLDNVSAVRITKVFSMLIYPNPNDPLDGIEIEVAHDKNPVHFTHEALEFLAGSQYTILDNGDYVFDLTGWDTSIPLFNIPKIQFNVVDYNAMLATFVKGPKSGERKKTQQTILSFPNNPVGALAALHDLVALRMSVSVSHLQLIILSSCCEDPENGDYRLPLNRLTGNPTSLSSILKHSSAVVALGYQTQEKDIYNPEYYTGQPRPDSDYDMLLLGVKDKDKNGV